MKSHSAIIRDRYRPSGRGVSLPHELHQLQRPPSIDPYSRPGASADCIAESSGIGLVLEPNDESSSGEESQPLRRHPAHTLQPAASSTGQTTWGPLARRVAYGVVPPRQTATDGVLQERVGRAWAMTDSVRIICGGPASPRNDYFPGEFHHREYAVIRNPCILHWLPEFWNASQSVLRYHSSIQSFCASDLQICGDSKMIRGSNSGRGSPCSPKWLTLSDEPKIMPSGALFSAMQGESFAARWSCVACNAAE
jgi:hypothetical protein